MGMPGRMPIHAPRARRRENEYATYLPVGKQQSEPGKALAAIDPDYSSPYPNQSRERIARGKHVGQQLGIPPPNVARNPETFPNPKNISNIGNF